MSGEILSWLRPGLDCFIAGLIATVTAWLVIVGVRAVAPYGPRQAIEILLRLLRSLDQYFVLLASFVTGTRYRSVTVRVCVLIVFLLATALGGAELPLPAALVALIVGVGGVFAVLRHWSWDEDERARNVPEFAKRIRVEYDLRDEAIWAVSWLFAFASIGFARLDSAYGFFPALPGWGVWSLLRYAAFAAGELVNVIPILHSAELGNPTGIKADTPIFASATFALRVIYEIGLIGAIVQLFAVAQRIIDGLDLRGIELLLSKRDEISQIAGILSLRALALQGRENARQRLSSILVERTPRGLMRFSPRLRIQVVSVLSDIAERFGGEGLLYEAIDAAREILKELGDSSPLDWAEAQNYLGIALKQLGERRGDDMLLEQAIDAYRAALTVLPRERHAVEWAITQHNLGVVLMTLGERRGDERLLEQSVEALREALSVWTRARTPVNWAGTQSNLGNALQFLGARRGDELLLEQAVEAYREAVKEWTRALYPLLWAFTQNNLGVVLKLLGERRGDEKVLEQAIEALREALKEWTRERVPLNWASAQNNLGNALQSLGEHRSDVNLLRQAIEAYNQALKEWTPERTPLDWAVAQHNLGVALTWLGDRTADETLLEQAIEAYRRALSEWTRNRVPQNFAMAQHGLGFTLHLLGLRRRDEKLLEAAIEAYRAAVEVFDALGAKAQAARARDNLQLVEADLAGIRDAGEDKSHLAHAAGANPTPSRLPYTFESQSDVHGRPGIRSEIYLRTLRVRNRARDAGRWLSGFR